MSTRWEVLGFGAVAIDDLLYVDHYPLPDSKTTVKETRRDGGGLTGTALVAAARLGARAAYCGVMGYDDLSRYAVGQLEEEGIDCTAVLYRDGARPIQSVIIVDMSTGARTIFRVLSGVIWRPPDAMTDELITGCRVLFVDDKSVASGRRAIEVAHRHGIPVVGDIEAGQDVDLLDMIDQIDHLIIGIDLAKRLTGETEPMRMVRALWHGKRACCVVTAGSLGCWYMAQEGDARHAPAFSVPVVDTTGCGDVFHGAYAASIALNDDVHTAIRVASATAALKATQPGGRNGIPRRDVVDRFLSARV
jgi:sulfofructose kinase